MAENNINSETNTIQTLQEAIRAQQLLLQKLYHELDVEREASATAASEALSMILRLQGEKASVKMEAEQYRRLAEEKMHLAQESMGIYKHIIHQKDLEIASLDHQVQAYRHKLVRVDKTRPPNLIKLAHLKGASDCEKDQNFHSGKKADSSLSLDISSLVHSGALSVHDVFEVPQTDQIHVSCEMEIIEGEKQELRLLYEIRDKVNSIHAEIRSGNRKTEKSSPNYDLPMLHLSEAMLHFWL